MSTTAAFYGNGSVVRTKPGFAAPIARAGVAGAERVQQPAALESAVLATAKLKSRISLFGAIWNAIKAVTTWIDDKFEEAEYRRIDGLFFRAIDQADLERRMRDMERQDQYRWMD